MEEIWKTVKEYEDYMVSNLGRVKSLKFGKEKILSQFYDKDGYNRVNLLSQGKQKNLGVHRLVALVFYGQNDLSVNHINGIKTDNRLENLEYVSNRENQSHKFKNKNTTSIYTGVSFHKKTNKWISEIQINGQKKHLGVFTNEIDAHNAYQNALKENNLTNKYAK